uniref:Glycosyltransferase family 1 protein n=1 Tax=candidate division WOR-3 bacterium TaxID=2052148 RepID=A0A7C3ND04_UNCW3
MKNILYIGHFDPEYKNAAWYRVSSNGKILNSLNYNVIYIGMNIKNKKITKKVNNQIILSYPNGFLQWISYLFKPDIFLKRIKGINNLNAIILYDLPCVPFLIILFYCKKHKIKIYSDSTEWYGFQGVGFIDKLLKGIDSFVRMTYLNKKVDGLILVSKNLFNYYNSVKNKIFIPPLVDKKEKKWNINNIENKELFDNVIKFIYFGEPGKTGKKDNLKKLISVFYSLKHRDYILNIVGISIQDYLSINKKEKDFLSELKNKIFFYGRMNQPETFKLLYKSDFTIFIRENNSINYYGFPTKFVESISMGIPVITTRTSNLDEFLIDGYNGYFVKMENLRNDLEKILNLKKSDIYRLKNNINKSIFDIDNYKKDFKKMLKFKEC